MRATYSRRYTTILNKKQLAQCCRHNICCYQCRLSDKILGKGMCSRSAGMPTCNKRRAEGMASVAAGAIAYDTVSKPW